MRKLILLLLFTYPAFGQDAAHLVTQYSATGNLTAGGSTCATTNACLALHLPQSSTSVTVTITGTWSATMVVESAADNGVTWVSAGTAPTANGQTTYTLTAQTDFRVRISAFTSGIIGIFINSSQAPTSSGGTGTPGGSSGSIQYNNASAFGGFGSYNSSSQLVTVPGGLATTTSGGFGGFVSSPEGTVGNGTLGANAAAGVDICYADSTSHAYLCSFNNSSFLPLVTAPVPHSSIAATAVTPGSYTSANITVAADGSITAAANGSGGGGAYSISKGQTSAVTQTGSYVTIYSQASVPALAAGACYTIEFGLNTPGSIDFLVELEVDSTVLGLLKTSTGAIAIFTQSFEYCNNAAVQNAQTLSYKWGGYQIVNGSSTSLTNYSNIVPFTTPTAVDWSATHTVSVITNGASSTVTGSFFRIRQ